MAKEETLNMLDELSAAVGRARAKRGPEHAASARALDAMATAVTATRAYAESELLLIDGSRGAARMGDLAKLWQKTKQLVLAVPADGEEKALLRGEGWNKPQPWEKLEKLGGWLWMKTLLDHCRWLITVLPGPAKR